MSDNLDGFNKEEGAVCEELVVKKLQENVDALYQFRDHYFESHSIDDAPQKITDLDNELKSVLNSFANLNVSEHRGMVFFLKGRALNVLRGYNKEAEDLLSKAVKLDPKLVEAWNELGDVYWKKDNIQEARNCFNAALMHRKNKVSLRNLSMVLRSVPPKTPEEQKENIEKGVECAKEAVQLDTNDGLSWAVLGNAYVSSFFCVAQDPQTYKLAMSAYAQAEKDLVAKNSPELNYNKAVVLRYDEDFEKALDSFALAQKLDPTWSDPSVRETRLLRYLDNIQDLIKQKGKLKSKKLKQMLQSMDEKQLGPYQGGSFSSKGQSVKLAPIPITELKPGINRETVVCGKVVCSVYNEDGVPFTFCLVDKAETCIAVTLFNLAEGKGVIIGDSVAIPEPFLANVQFKYKTSKFDFQLLRVQTPLLMVVNGRKYGRDQLASTQYRTYQKDE